MGEWFLTSWLIISASVSKSEQSKRAGLLNFFLDWFLEFEGTRTLQNVGGPSSTDTTPHPRIHEPQNLTQQFLLSLGLDTSLTLRACALIKFLSIHCRCLSHEHKMAKHCATNAPQILAGSVTLFVFFPLGAFVFVLALLFLGGASYSIRKWSAAGINFKWTLFAVTSSRMVNAGRLSRLQCMVMISSPSVVLGVLTWLQAESCCCLSYLALKNGFSPVVKTHCVQFMWLQGLHPHLPYCCLITACVHLLHLSSFWVFCWSVNFDGNLSLEMVFEHEHSQNVFFSFVWQVLDRDQVVKETVNHTLIRYRTSMSSSATKPTLSIVGCAHSTGIHLATNSFHTSHFGNFVCGIRINALPL